MHSKNWLNRINHIQECIKKIQNYTKGLDYETFKRNDLAVDAVLTNIIIIGEATIHVPEEIKTRYSEIPWALMKAMRNVLTHEYERVKIDIVWETITTEIPPLIPILERILKENSDL